MPYGYMKKTGDKIDGFYRLQGGRFTFNNDDYRIVFNQGGEPIEDGVYKIKATLRVGSEIDRIYVELSSNKKPLHIQEEIARLENIKAKPLYRTGKPGIMGYLENEGLINASQSAARHFRYACILYLKENL